MRTFFRHLLPCSVYDCTAKCISRRNDTWMTEGGGAEIDFIYLFFFSFCQKNIWNKVNQRRQTLVTDRYNGPWRVASVRQRSRPTATKRQADKSFEVRKTVRIVITSTGRASTRRRVGGGAFKRNFLGAAPEIGIFLFTRKTFRNPIGRETSVRSRGTTHAVWPPPTL